MDVYTIDFETYYSDVYSLTKMKTEQYVRDPRFEAQCVAISKNFGPPVCIPKPQIKEILAKIPWSTSAVLGQNTMFDGFILSERYGHHPMFYMDTKALFNREYPHLKATLHNIAKVLRLKTQKGVMDSKGMRYDDFTPEQLAAHMNYCKDDVRVTQEAWAKLKPRTNVMELQLIDMTIRWYCKPQLVLDPQLLLDEIESERVRKEALLATVVADKKQLMSNPQLAALLEQLGVDVPIKASVSHLKKNPDMKQFVEDYNHWLLTHDFAVNERNIHITSIDENGDPEYGTEPAYPWTYAFSRTDTNFKHLTLHPDERVAALVEARLGVKSTIAESRAKTLHGVSQRGKMPVPLIYWGAATGRWSGCLVGSTEITVYDRAQDRVLTKRIVDVLPDDLVWDGEEFVEHDGVKFQGYREVITHDEITGTDDHPVFTTSDTTVSLSEALSTGQSIMEAAAPDSGAVDRARRRSTRRQW